MILTRSFSRSCGNVRGGDSITQSGSSQKHQSISGRFHAHTDQRRDQELITNCDKSFLPLEENATARVKVGDIGYWPPGEALAIFFGPISLSSGNDPVPASAVNVVGRITGDAGLFRNARGAVTIRIEAG
jgi:hypothetical protein